MMKLKVSVITMMLLCVISTISSRLKEHEVVRNAKTESTTAIRGSNPNQSQNKDFRDQQDESKNQFTNKTSIYIGVSWNKHAKKWQAELYHKQKRIYGRLFDKEEDAAMKVNLLCDIYEVKRKNPMIDLELFEDHQTQHPTSKYTGVSWNTRDKKWLAQLMHNGKSYSGGVFDKEEHATMKVNLLCDKFGIKRKNPMIIIEPDAIQQYFKNKTSIYIGVCWDNNAKKWKAKLHHNQKSNYGGLFDKEEDAAMKVNLLCDTYEVKRKNPMIDIALFEDHQAQNLSSQYIGVSWHKNTKTWQAQLMHKGKKFFAGLFGTEKNAAIQLNLLCEELGIEHKNPMIDIEFDPIAQKTKSSQMYQSKAENITNEKEVKVEEENIVYGLKDQCENNFMKQTCQRQKRKRKDSILKINKIPNHDGNEVFEEIQKDYIKILDYTIPPKNHFHQF